jgi:hypothetical protein
MYYSGICVKELKTTKENLSGKPVSEPTFELSKKVKVKQSRYTPWRRLGGRGGIASTHS